MPATSEIPKPSVPSVPSPAPATNTGDGGVNADNSGKNEPIPKLGFTGSVIYAVAKVFDSGWGGAARFVGIFRDVDPNRATLAVLAISMILGAVGATTAVGIMGYVLLKRPTDQDSSTSAALIKVLNEQEDKRVLQEDKRALERDRDHERASREHDARMRSEEKARQELAALTKEVSRSVAINERVARTLEKLSGKLPDPSAPMPRNKSDDRDTPPPCVPVQSFEELFREPR